MNVRVQLGLLIAVCLLANRPACAQDYQSQGSRPAPSGAVTPAGFQQYGHAPQAYSGPGVDELTAYQLLPDDRGFLYDLDSRLDLSILENARGSWIRLEVWNASINTMTGKPLGAKTLDATGNNIIQDPSKQFELATADANGTLQPIFGFTIPVQAATTQGVDFHNISGVKGTIGIPVTKNDWIEASAWGLQDTTTHLKVPIIPPSSTLGAYGLPRSVAIVVPLTTNGQIGNRVVENGLPVNHDRVIVYDNSFFTSYQVDTWSSEVNYVHDLVNSQNGFSLKPLVGYRHTEYGEDLRFGGSFNNTSGYLDFADLNTPATGVLAVPVSSSISSSVRNFRNEFQVGFRSEIEHKWFTLGIEPKVGLGLNLVRAQVTANNVRAPGDIGLVDPSFSTITDGGAITTTRDREMKFSSTLDLGLYANLHLSDKLKLHVGYDLIWLANMGVADHQIKYNENTVTVVDPMDPTMSTTTSTSDVVLQKGFQSRAISAFTIGGELILW